jgi:hypothetical protein
LSEPLSLEFADRASGIRGWIGRGLAGLGADDVLVLLFDGEEQLIAGPVPGATVSARNGDSAAEAAAGDTKLRVEVGGADRIGPLSHGTAKVEIEAGGKRSLTCQGAFGSLAGGEDAGLVRTLVALRDDGGSLALRASRGASAGAHGDEQVEAWLAEPDAAAQTVSEPLLSTEYTEDGAQARAGLELWVGQDDQAPVRGAGTRSGGARLELDGWRLDAAFLDWSIGGVEGAGSYLIWKAGD